jgi:hypothetical protein
MDRNFLKGAHGDAANAILAAAGYNFRRQCHIDTQLAGRIECGIAREHEKNKLRWISVSA